MPFIGNQPALSYTSFAKQDFTTSATTSYTLDNPVANANELALFINFVRQEPTTAYSASGTTLTLTEATSASDDMYCVYLGKAVQTVNPPNASVGTSQLVDNSVTSGKLFSGFANGITMADQWRLTAITNTGTDADVTTNWERNDSSGYSSIGTGLTESSGIFSFPQTGIYLIYYVSRLLVASGDTSANFDLKITLDNSSYNTASRTANGNSGSSSTVGASSNMFLFDVTDTSNCKFKFTTESFNSGTYVSGSTSTQNTGFLALRLGDT